MTNTPSTATLEPKPSRCWAGPQFKWNKRTIIDEYVNAQGVKTEQRITVR